MLGLTSLFWEDQLIFLGQCVYGVCLEVLVMETIHMRKGPGHRYVIIKIGKRFLPELP